jgi:hypothetical protein
MRLQVDAHSPIPRRRQLTEPRKHVIEGGSAPRNQALPSIRELVGFVGINPEYARARDRGSQAAWVPAASPPDSYGALVHSEGAPGPGRHAGGPVW